MVTRWREVYTQHSNTSTTHTHIHVSTRANAHAHTPQIPRPHLRCSDINQVIHHTSITWIVATHTTSCHWHIFQTALIYLRICYWYRLHLWMLFTKHIVCSVFMSHLSFRYGGQSANHVVLDPQFIQNERNNKTRCSKTVIKRQISLAMLTNTTIGTHVCWIMLWNPG